MSVIVPDVLAQHNSPIADLLRRARALRKVLYQPHLESQIDHRDILCNIRDDYMCIIRALEESFTMSHFSPHRFIPDGNDQSPIAFCAGFGLLTELRIVHQAGADLQSPCDDAQCDPRIKFDMVSEVHFGNSEVIHHISRTPLEYALLGLEDLFYESYDRHWNRDHHFILARDFPLLPSRAKKIILRSDLRLFAPELQEKNALIAYLLDHFSGMDFRSTLTPLTLRHLRLLSVSNLQRLLWGRYPVLFGEFHTLHRCPKIIARLLCTGITPQFIGGNILLDYFSVPAENTTMDTLREKLFTDLVLVHPQILSQLHCLIPSLSEETIFIFLNGGQSPEIFLRYPSIRPVLSAWVNSQKKISPSDPRISIILTAVALNQDNFQRK